MSTTGSSAAETANATGQAACEVAVAVGVAAAGSAGVIAGGSSLLVLGAIAGSTCANAGQPVELLIDAPGDPLEIDPAGDPLLVEAGLTWTGKNASMTA